MKQNNINFIKIAKNLKSLKNTVTYFIILLLSHFVFELSEGLLENIQIYWKAINSYSYVV